MYCGRTIQESETPLSFLAKAPLERLLPHAQTRHHTRGAVICASDQLVDWVFLVLRGRCEHRRNRTDGRQEVLQTFQQGDVFGGLHTLPPEPGGTFVVAAADSSVLRLQREEMAEVLAEAGGHEPTPVSATRIAPVFRPAAGRLVTLVFLSKRLPAVLLGEQVARALHAETGASVALVRLRPARDTFATNDPRESDCILNGEVRLPADFPTVEGGFHLLRIGVAAEPHPAGVIGELLDTLRQRFRYVLVDTMTEHLPTLTLFEFIHRSDLACFLLQPATEDVYRLDLLLRELRGRLKLPAATPLKSVLCLAENEVAGGFDELIEHAGLPNQAYVRGCPKLTEPPHPLLNSGPTGSFSADVRRLAREIGDRLVGLALSSGGAKGLAHIGVIQVLEENGIEADLVAGSSMGAYVGALWAFGCNGQKLEQLAREMSARWALWGLIDPVFPPRQGFLRGYAVKRRFQRTIGDARFADLARPLRVVATNLETLERVIFSRGEVATAVHASIAVPGICVPVRIGHETYVDGGVVDPLPVDVLREMGARRIIAVNVIPTPDRIRCCLQAERELVQQNERRTRKLLRRLLPLDRELNYFARGNILEILMRSIHGAQIRVAEAAGRRADLVLRPDICDDRWLDYRSPGRYIALGRKIAEAHLGEIRALLERKVGDHEYRSAPESLATVA